MEGKENGPAGSHLGLQSSPELMFSSSVFLCHRDRTSGEPVSSPSQKVEVVVKEIFSVSWEEVTESLTPTQQLHPLYDEVVLPLSPWDQLLLSSASLTPG